MNEIMSKQYEEVLRENLSLIHQLEQLQAEVKGRKIQLDQQAAKIERLKAELANTVGLVSILSQIQALQEGGG